jgi:hypothetical protein
MRYPEAIQQLAVAVRTLILEEAPEAGEFVYEVYTIADHFSFTGRPGDAFVFTTAHTNWVNLGFNFGAFLQDPCDLLRGDGKCIRHVRINGEADLRLPGVRELIKAAAAQAERPEEQPEKPGCVVHRSRTAAKRKAAGPAGSTGARRRTPARD